MNRVLKGAAVIAPTLLIAAGVGVWALSRQELSERETLDPDSAASGQFLALDGRRIHYQVKGQGKPVVLIHGFGASIITWRHNFAVLAEQFRVYMLDLPGFGFSAKGRDNDYTWAAQADTIAALLDHGGATEPVSLIGNSMGGAIALEFALAYPERVDKLVLIDAAAYLPSRRMPAWGGRLFTLYPPLTRLAIAKTLLNPKGMDNSLRRVYHDPNCVTPELREAFYQPARTPGAADALVQMINDFPKNFIADRLGQLQAPALVIWGDDDKLIPLEQGERLARELPHARLVVIPEAGHLPHEEQPAEVNALIREFLSARAAFG